MVCSFSVSAKEWSEQSHGQRTLTVVTTPFILSGKVLLFTGDLLMQNWFPSYATKRRIEERAEAGLEPYSDYQNDVLEEMHRNRNATAYAEQQRLMALRRK